MSLNYILKQPFQHRGLARLKDIFFVLLFFSITSVNSQTTFTSVQSGNYTNPATWGTATAPTSNDHAVISAGTTVTLDDVLTAQDVTISGSLESTAASSEFTVEGNLAVNLGGLF